MAVEYDEIGIWSEVKLAVIKEYASPLPLPVNRPSPEMLRLIDHQVSNEWGVAIERNGDTNLPGDFKGIVALSVQVKR